jgi:arylsulfatase A-like enzyme
MQGRSLLPLLTGAAPLDEFREDVYCEYYNSNPNNPRMYLTMTRERRYKIIAIHNTREGELYDLEKDPWERVNLWNDPTMRDVKIEMLQRMAARMAYTADPLPERIGVF